MTKAILNLGYTDYVLELKDAVTVAEMLSKAEVHESKYVSNGPNTHHIYPAEKEIGSIRLISTDFYQMCKLAGKPVKD